jgi:metal-responsive CopG/Arc/MetJ family transcriptional regulator
MKTAVSLPDSVFDEAEELARVQNTSRSRLYAAALREYLARHAPERVTAALDALYEHEPSTLDPVAASLASRVLERAEW